jgi:hypothetical protein
LARPDRGTIRQAPRRASSIPRGGALRMGLLGLILLIVLILLLLGFFGRRVY